MKLQPQVLPVRTQAATAGVTQETCATIRYNMSQSPYLVLLRRIPEKSFTTKIMRVQQTREIWQVTAVIEEDLETTEGSCTLELTDWKVPDKEKRMRP